MNLLIIDITSRKNKMRLVVNNFDFRFIYLRIIFSILISSSLKNLALKTLPKKSSKILSSTVIKTFIYITSFS